MPKLTLKENYSINSLLSATSINSNSAKNFNQEPAIAKTNGAENKKDDFILYTVQQKETIWAIAQKYKVNIDDLVKWNQLQGSDLKAGQQIKIYK